MTDPFLDTSVLRAHKPPISAQWLERWLSLVIVSVVALAAVAAFRILADGARADLVDTKRAAAQTMTRVFAASLGAPLELADEDGLRSKLDGLRSNDQVIYAAVWRADPLWRVAELGHLGLDLPERVPVARVLRDRLEIAEPVLDRAQRRVGTALVAFTLVPELARYETSRNRIAVLAVLLALALSTGSIAVARGRLARRRSKRSTQAESSPRSAGKNLDRVLSQLALDNSGGPRPGDVLGQYQLLTCVGEGGMGRVWAARHMGSALHRLVAVKTAIRDDEERIELRHLFMDEARIALLARHPNVCGVHEFGEHDGVLYQVLEWCDGASLRQVLDRLPEGRMDLPVAVRIVIKVAAGLHAAHELLDEDGLPMHVVHRDVSPQNILISTNGEVKVTDFGVAKAHGQLHRPTDSGEVKGKLSYMAPEQVMGQDVDRRADIFALGCILYEATTGHSPFSGEGALSTMYRLLSQPVVPPRARVARYPNELAAIVLRALDKQPMGRYTTAEQFGVALESWLAETSPVVTERTIVELMAQAVGAFTREKCKRIEQALASLPASNSPSPRAIDLTPGFSPRVMLAPERSSSPGSPERPTIPARPVTGARSTLPESSGVVSHTTVSPQPSVSVRPAVSGRSTMPAGPAARKPGVP